MQNFNHLPATRIVAAPTALDSLNVANPDDTVMLLRTAPDELLTVPPLDDESRQVILDSDPHAIIVPEGSLVGSWFAEEDALAILSHTCEWELPTERSAMAQGAVAGLPVKLWFAADGTVTFIVSMAFAADLEERIA